MTSPIGVPATEPPRPRLTDKDLMYAATARCRCGAGLAHPLDHELAGELRAWVCSAVLRGDVDGPATRVNRGSMFVGPPYRGR